MWIGARQAAINVAEGRKQATILASEAEKSEQINKASGEAEAILLRAQASAKGIEKVALAIGQMNGKDAVSMTVAEKYVDAFGRMAKEGTTMIVPASANDAASMVAQVKRIGDIGYILSLTWILFFFSRHCPFTTLSTSQGMLHPTPHLHQPIPSPLSKMRWRKIWWKPQRRNQHSKSLQSHHREMHWPNTNLFEHVI